jgi:hypothetical protein
VGTGADKANELYLASSAKPERELEDGSGAVLLPRERQRASERGIKVGTIGAKMISDLAAEGKTAEKAAPTKRNMVVVEKKKSNILVGLLYVDLS